MTDEQRHHDGDAEPTQVVGPQRDSEATQVIDPVRDEATQVIDPVRDEPTQVIGPDEPRGSHQTGPEPTQVLPAEELHAERERREAEARETEERMRAEREAAERRRIEQQEARQRALGTVTPAGENTDMTPPVVHKRTTDKFFGSLGLFLLRLVTAAIMGIHGYQKLTDHAATTQFFESVGLPRADLMAWGVGVAEVLAAIALVFGFLVRFAGAGVAAIAIAALAMVKWGAKNPFQPGQSGFIGEFELLLAGVGLLFLLLGGGGWGIDAGYRRSRQRRKAGLN